MKLNPETLARASSRHPGSTIGIWAVVLFAGFAALSTLLSPGADQRLRLHEQPGGGRGAEDSSSEKGLEQDVSARVLRDGGRGGCDAEPAFAEKVNAALNDIRGLDPRWCSSSRAAYPALRPGRRRS